MEIWIIGNTYINPSKFDFSFAGIAIYEIESKKFLDYLQSLVQTKINTSDLLNSLNNENYHESDKRYAVVKTNLDEAFDIEKFNDVLDVLRIIYPSNLSIYYEMSIDEEFQIDPLAKEYNIDFDEYPTEYIEQKLEYVNDNIKEINEFLSLYFKNLNDSNNYIQRMIRRYITSFSAQYIEFRFLVLCMALESTIPRGVKVTHRLRKSIAIICGDSKVSCDKIANYVNYIYNIRSNIIHGAPYSIDEINKNMETLRSLVSRTIIELLDHGIDTNEKLSLKIKELGYGERNKISKNYKNFKLNPSTYIPDII